MAELLCLEIQRHFQISHEYLKVHHSLQTHVHDAEFKITSTLKQFYRYLVLSHLCVLKPSLNSVERAKKPHKILGNTVAVLKLEDSN